MNASPFHISVVIPIYNDGIRAVSATEAIMRQSLPQHFRLDIILVNDGSTDDTAALLKVCTGPATRVLTLPRNIGRSAARNAGVATAKGNVVVFMDCDCLPASGLLEAHVAALSRGAVASTGPVAGDGAGFWTRYQSAASERRRRQHANGISYSGSSQNLAVRRDAFDKIGGFDPGYQRYGFEDRDLLLRLAELGNIAWVNEALVNHMDALTLPQVAAKMVEAGQYTSTKFAERHPAAYRALGFATIDANVNWWLRPIGRSIGPAAVWLSARLDPWLDRVPFALGIAITRTITALAYLKGTTDAVSQES